MKEYSFSISYANVGNTNCTMRFDTSLDITIKYTVQYGFKIILTK